MLKTIRDFLEPRYQQVDVLAVCGLTAMTLQNWNARGLGARPPSERPGTGKRRAYTTLDVLVLALMKALTDLNVPVPFARDLAAEIVAPMFDTAKSPADPAKIPVDTFCILFPASGKNQFEVEWYFADDSLPDKALAPRRQSGGFIVLPASRIVDRVIRALTNLLHPAELDEDPELTLEERARATWEGSEEIRQEFDSFEQYRAFRRAVEGGRVKFE